MNNYLAKFQEAASKVGVQATAFAQNTGRQINEQAKLAQAGFSLPKECEKAAKILQAFVANPDHPDSALNSIPKAVLQNAKGLAVFSVVKAGFVWSGRAGSGVVVARLPDGSWSAPSCIATGGAGFGLQIGAEISDFVVVMNSEDAVRSFALAGNLTIGGNMSAAAGPIGVGAGAQAALAHPAPMFSYSRSKGLYAGISLDGSVLVERKDANREFYGSPVPAADLLAGKVPAPEAASAMYEVVEAAEAIDETGLPQQAYIPTGQPGQTQPVSAPYHVGGDSAAAAGGAPNTLFDASAAEHKA
ncbi:DUF500-domain-containing protein [Tilletiopsis washingtonensis]|uniref:DUF500-domain-containing protein n=1 Tax=Tilletiopsis washingtonensis TaxID=58919 RepID=A0A316Z3N1_9BASI|nr:DUF500-domain-containing protein [Tilletiopsis washingtonensis]PWN96161.1 DUF500-domain-containing protein [Tilletiopsis washingtonensis]